MTAGRAFESAAIARLRTIAALTFVGSEAPARASYPYLITGPDLETGWNSSGQLGRELTFGLSLFDDDRFRAIGLEDLIEARMDAVGAVEGWLIASCMLLRKERRVRPMEACSTMFTYRARLIQAVPAGAAA